MSFVGEEQGKDEQDDWSPRYWDLFAKVERDLTSSQTLSLKLLLADDGLTIDQRDAFETTDARTGFGNLTVGLDHQAFLGDRLVARTLLSASRVDRDRSLRWSEADEWIVFEDDRQLDVLGLRQEWSLSLSDRNFLKWGFEARSLDVEYDYFNQIVDRNYIDDPRFPPPLRTTAFVDRIEGEQYGLWLADRVRLGRGSPPSSAPATTSRRSPKTARSVRGSIWSSISAAQACCGPVGGGSASRSGRTSSPWSSARPSSIRRRAPTS